MAISQLPSWAAESIAYMSDLANRSIPFPELIYISVVLPLIRDRGQAPKGHAPPQPVLHD